MRYARCLYACDVEVTETHCSCDAVCLPRAENAPYEWVDVKQRADGTFIGRALLVSVERASRNLALQHSRCRACYNVIISPYFVMAHASPSNVHCWREMKGTMHTDPCSIARSLVQESTGRATAPNVFIDGASVGGGDDVVALQASGKLAELLKAR